MSVNSKEKQGDDIPSLVWHSSNIRIETLHSDWQEIRETKFAEFSNDTYKPKYFVYSAHLDIYKNVLRIIAVTPLLSKQKLHCHIFDGELQPVGVFEGIISATKNPQSYLPYSAAYILCKPEVNLFRTLKYVSISPFPHHNSSHGFSNLLPINLPPAKSEKEPHTFSVCVQPTFDYDNVAEFIQWMEFYKNMGVTHFTFYNMSIGPRVSCVMKSAAVNQETGITILNWTVPIKDHLQLHVNGQLAQQNDCLLRYRGVTKYLVLVDFDELIIPNYVYASDFFDLVTLMDNEWSSQPRNGSLAQYKFRSAIFDFDFSNLSDVKKDIYKDSFELEDLIVYKYVIRQRDLYPSKIRSKLITMPWRVLEPGVHFLDKAVDDRTEFEIDPEIAYVHHYRRFYHCKDNHTCYKIPQSLDYLAHFYADNLYKKARNVIDKLVAECS
ncbi:hypothetical protein Fcan01_10882 [Folsomia candida]|uniref:Glycosyltransferase family 92 protein n=1 Tax=Folsomia candida TaxID=158441 RepID=A0A226E8N4_FOLCA|nr:hypothetical protein Fcan01_10882 [Folsomia candida]